MTRLRVPPGTASASAPSPRLWVVSELYWPEETSTGYFLTAIAARMARHHDVHVLCSQPTYSSRGVVAPRREVHDGVDIERCPGTRLSKDVLAFRLVNLLTISLAIAWRALRRFRRGDVVLVVTNPPLLPFLVTLAARLRGARTALLIHDVYPEVLVATGMARPRSALVRTVALASRALYRAVDRIVVLGRDMEALVARKRASRGAEGITIIPNWGDVEGVPVRPRAGNPVLERLGIADRFVVQFMGNMGRTHGIETLAEAARLLRDDPDVRFLFIGWGGRKRWLEEFVAREGLANVHVLPPCPREELADHLAACDLSAIAFLPGMAGVSVPSRMYNVLASGRPILAVADDDSELARVVREEQVGLVVPPADPAAVVAAIRDAVARREELAVMGRRARAAAEARYTLDVVERDYTELFAPLLAGGS